MYIDTNAAWENLKLLLNSNFFQNLIVGGTLYFAWYTYKKTKSDFKQIASKIIIADITEIYKNVEIFESRNKDRESIKYKISYLDSWKKYRHEFVLDLANDEILIIDNLFNKYNTDLVNYINIYNEIQKGKIIQRSNIYLQTNIDVIKEKVKEILENNKNPTEKIDTDKVIEQYNVDTSNMINAILGSFNNILQDPSKDYNPSMMDNIGVILLELKEINAKYSSGYNKILNISNGKNK